MAPAVDTVDSGGHTASMTQTLIASLALSGFALVTSLSTITYLAVCRKRVTR